MRLLITSAALLALGAFSLASADDQSSMDRDGGDDASTIAVYGDAPYGCKLGECPSGYNPDTVAGPNPGDPRQLDATPAFIDAVNTDPKVRLVIHAGDIHSGSGFCTLDYDKRIADLWSQFRDPLVYTPGDNEWADCHKSGEGGVATASPTSAYVDYANGHPLANLALVRSLFFPDPGETLGKRKKNVLSQGVAYDKINHPSDGEYVENVMWEQSGVLFVTVNIPGGSNNDDDIWYGSAAGRTGAQIQEVAQRTGADLRWLDAAFARARVDGVKGIVIVEQADMWDLDGKAESHIANYETFIDSIAANTTRFGKPVLLINGDSHNYRSDNPLKAGQPCAIEAGPSVGDCTDDAWENHSPSRSYDVDSTKFHRLVVHGSTFPLEYLRMTINPNATNPAADNAFGPFSWERVNP